ncbi:MAG: tetratricopeptide repeat protein [Gammaproteobacteria bacterium]|nr:tetratricopeptide repeat protein [Gammaproteobacteria bacterium]
MKLRMLRYLMLLIVIFSLFVLITTRSVYSNINNEVIWSNSYELEAKGKYKAAAGLIEPLLTQGNDTLEFTLLRYAWLNYLGKNFNDALRSYKRALTLNPSSLDAQLGITLVLLAQQEWNELELVCHKILRQSPWNYHAHLRLMETEQYNKNWLLLKNHAQRVASHFPSESEPLLYLARAEKNLGAQKKAYKVYNRVLKRQPGNIEALTFVQRMKSK